MNEAYVRTQEDATQASEMFMDAGQGGGGPWVECLCGKSHFALRADWSDFDEDDLEEDANEEGFKIPPEDENTVHHVDEYVYYITFNGQQAVTNCEGCRTKLKRYEDFIWEQRDIIREYLRIRIKQEKDWADYETTKNVLAGI